MPSASAWRAMPTLSSRSRAPSSRPGKMWQWRSITAPSIPGTVWNSPMRRVLMLVAACVLLAVGIAVAIDQGNDGAERSTPGAQVRVGDASVRAEVADDEASRRQGLSGRERLGADEGMLFVLPGDSPSFWMKGMRFPLDIIWIRQGRVVDISADVPPPRDPDAPLPTYSP